LTAIAESKKIHTLSFMKGKSGRTIDFSSDGFIRDSLDTINSRGYQSYAVSSLNSHLKVNKKPLDPYIVAIAVVDLNGKVVSSTNEKMIGKDMSKHELFVNSIKNNYGETYVSHSYNSPYLDKDCIFISAPLTRKHGGDKIGIIINAYDLESLNEITANRVGMGETGEVVIGQRKGNDIIFLTSLRYSSDAVLELTVSMDDPAAEPMEKALSGNNGLIIAPDYKNTMVLAAYQYIPEIGWGLVAKMDKAEAFKPLRPMGIIALALGGVSSITVVGMGIMFAVRASRPINELTDATEIFASGDLNYRIKVTQNDEVGILARSFNDMAGKLSSEIAGHKRAEDELVATNKELEAFCYSVSHDLRAPLRGIDGFSKILEEEYTHKLDEQGMGYIKRIRAASQRMGQLISDLLNLSRITRVEMKHEKVDLSAMVKRKASRLQETQPDRQVEFIIAEGLYVNGDEGLLRVAMNNLLGNAWKFTEKHSQARIEFGITKNDSGHVYFVRDDGTGFDMTYVDKLFGAFQRLHSLSEFEGTGIGLATVQRIIHRHGGRIWAKGAVEQGATFYFTL
jgi:signal transduction histidine kinase